MPSIRSAQKKRVKHSQESLQVNKYIIASIILVFLSFTCLIFSARMFPYSPIHPSRMHVQGSVIKNNLNETVVLRGVNRALSFCDSCTGNFYEDGAWQYEALMVYSEKGVRDRLRQMSDLGFNVVRLILNVDWWLNNKSITLKGYATNVPCRYALERVVILAQEYNMYVVICPYMADIYDEKHSFPFPTKTLPNQQAYVSFMEKLGNTFKNYPNAIIELWNEPNSVDWSVALRTFSAALKAIRNSGFNGIIIIQYGECNSFDWVPYFATKLSTYKNIVYSNHIYRSPAGLTMLSRTDITSKNEIRDWLIKQWRYDLVIGKYPVFIGEIGCYGDSSEEKTWFANTLSLLNEWGFGYAAWGWDQIGIGFDLQNAPNNAPYPPNEKAQILVNSILHD